MASEALISLVVDRLVTYAQEKATLVRSARGEVGKLTRTLTLIQKVLADAEQKQVTNDAVRVWLANLKDVVYDAEDVLDEWNTKTALSRRQTGDVDVNIASGSTSKKIDRPLQRHGGRLDHNETYCGSCYGAETSDDECCNSGEQVREAYQKKGWGLTNPDMIDQCKREGFVDKVKEEVDEGCNIEGFLEVNKVAGSFHFAPAKSFFQSNVHLFDLLSIQMENSNISHKINKLSFGQRFPGAVNPLDGVQWTQHKSSGMYQYFIKVVPTIYTDIRGRKINSNQFSVTEHFRTADGYTQFLPGVFFFYDFSPIKVSFNEESVSLLHFLTNICAIIGGIFTVSGIIDSLLYHSHRAIKKKMEIGKFG